MKFIPLSIILLAATAQLYAGGFRDHSLPGSRQQYQSQPAPPTVAPKRDRYHLFRTKAKKYTPSQLRASKASLQKLKNGAIKKKDQTKIKLYGDLILIIEQQEAQ